MSVTFVAPLATTPSLAQLGGKGRSLARLITAGFPVPAGFHVTTAAYQQFIAANDLQAKLLAAARPEVLHGALSFAAASRTIQAMIDAGMVPAPITDAITTAFAALGDAPVAVRSSATAEDLPDLSFAGQQDTYLNIRGREAVLAAIRHCWASLWTDRALSYRHQMGIAHDDVAMAVVVQQMVSAEVSGVLFTANPATGERGEMIVNASYGLGEAIVSGDVTPDAFVVDRATLLAKEVAIGAKERMVVADGDHGTRFEAVASARAGEASLTSPQLQELATAALAVEAHFDGAPQDIEWLFASGKLWLLQARPITNLPPAPLRDVRWEAPEPFAFLGRSQLVEHIPDPVSPLFEDLHMKRSLQHYWGRNLMRRGLHDYAETQPPSCFYVQTTVNGYAYRHVGEPPRTGRLPGKPKRQWLPASLRKRLATWQRRWMMFRIYVLFVPKWRYVALPRYLREVAAWRALDVATATTEQLWAGIRAMSLADARYWYDAGVWNAFSLTRGTESQLHDFLQKQTGGAFTSGQFLSGLPSVAFNGQLALWRIARSIRTQPALHADVIATPPARLAELLRAHPQGAAVCRDLDAYLATYGHQIFTLDFAEPSEAEDPASLMRNLHALVLQADYDPEQRQRQLAEKRTQAEAAVRQHLHGTALRTFRWFLWKARHYYPNREEAMFHMGKAWTVLRPMAHELGRRLAEVGTLRQPDDVYYLTTDELGRSIRALVRKAGLPEYKDLTAARRELRIARRQLTAPFHVPGPPPWSKPEPEVVVDANTLKGSPVSPGKVTGVASVILSPADFQRMRPGSILVCPTTTPAWTQLFPQATGLVTNVGGILAHGSIVAREYGIPAVLGVTDATRRIVDGQTITVDGSRGTVQIGQETP